MGFPSFRNGFLLTGDLLRHIVAFTMSIKFRKIHNFMRNSGSQVRKNKQHIVRL